MRVQSVAFFTILLLTGTLSSARAQRPCPEPAAREFDFWVGEWNVVNRYLINGQWQTRGAAEVDVFPVAGGCGIVELWDGTLGRFRVRGFSLRGWVPEKNAWVLVLNWPQPERADFSTLEGTFRHGRGDFFSGDTVNGKPTLTRYSFADITPDHFRWNDGTSLDSGQTWATRWIMEYSRRNPNARPVSNLPFADAPLEKACKAPGTERFDGALGRWRSADGTSNYRSLKILDGCAIMDFLEWTDADGNQQEVFLVRSWEHASSHWVQYARTSTISGMLRFEGDGPAGLVATDAPGSSISWQIADDGKSLVLTWEQPGAPPSPMNLLRRP